MRRIFGLFCVLVFSVFFSLFYINNNTYAESVSDYVFTFDSSNTNAIGICHESNPNSSLSGHKCSDYTYMIFESEYSSSTVYFTFDNYNRLQFNNLNPMAVIPLSPQTGGFSVFTYNVSSLPSDWSATLTLSNIFPGASCPEPEPPEPCPDPEENSRFIQVVLDAFWKYHQVFGGAVVAIIVIFFVYRLIKGVMR